MCTDDEDSPDLTEVLAAVRSLGARVTALERNARSTTSGRSTASGETANLDEMDTETRKLVAAVDRGKRARTMVSMQSVKGHPWVTIHDFENATRDREEHLKRALAASKVLASTDKWSSTRNDAAAAFRTASSELEGAESRIARG